MKFALPLIAFVCMLAACGPETYTPKPRGYYHIQLPEHEYQQFSRPDFPYSFEYPVYGRTVTDTTFFGKKPEDPYWMNIDFPELGGRIHISYKQIKPGQDFATMLEDSYEMSYFHTKRADYIEDFVFHEGDVHGIFYNVGGDAASAYQFYATDSVKHFLRGALYFNVSPNADSLKPVNEFLRTDIEHMLKTLRWTR